MKKQTLLALLVLLLSYTYAQPYSIEGYVYLENQTDHSGVEITFNRIAPTALTITANTDANGYYTQTLEEGIYNIVYEHTDFLTDSHENFAVYSELVIPELTLETVGLSGELSGILAFGTYKVSADISVAVGETLVIEPGTRLLFKEGVNCMIYGELIAQGTESDSIVFDWYDEGLNWNGLSIYGSEANGELSYIKLMHSSATGIVVFGDCNISNSTVSYNTGNNNGGGISISATNKVVTITNTEVTYNQAAYGGGIFIGLTTDIDAGTERPKILNCIISNNTAYAGAALYFSLWYYDWVRAPLISNSVMSYNTCTDVSNAAVEGELGTPIPTVVNSIISHNQGYGVRFEYNPNYFAYNNTYANSSGNYSQPTVNIGNNVTTTANGNDCDAYHNIQEDPLFVDGENLDFHLLDQSPCINVGLNDSCLTSVDFENNDRIYSANGTPVVDMGVYENSTATFVKDKAWASRIFVVPNPTSGVVNIQNESLIQNVKVFNVTGQLVYEQEANQNQTTLDLSRVKSGIYMIKVKSGNTTTTHRLVKQ